MNKIRLLAISSIGAIALSPVSAGAAVTLPWTGSTNFDTETQTFAGVSASSISFSGSGYFHNHSGTAGFTLEAQIDGSYQTILSYLPGGPVTSALLSSFGTISFTGGNVTAIRLSSTSSVGWAFHSFNGETFTLDGTVSGVPEPASWAMMIGGLAIVGSAMRRRASRVSFA